MDRVLNRRRLQVIRDILEVDRNNRDAVGELLDVLASRIEAVEVVEVGESREEVVGGAAHLEANDDAHLAGTLDLVDLDNGGLAAVNLVKDALVAVKERRTRW